MSFLDKIKAFWFTAAKTETSKSLPVLTDVVVEERVIMVPEHILNRADVTNEMACEVVTVMVNDVQIESVSGGSVLEDCCDKE